MLIIYHYYPNVDHTRSQLQLQITRYYNYYGIVANELRAGSQPQAPGNSGSSEVLTSWVQQLPSSCPDHPTPAPHPTDPTCTKAEKLCK